MLNLQTLKIEPFTELLSKSYELTFGNLHPEYINFLKMASSISLENIANGDMLYHNVDHTIMVTSVGQENYSEVSIFSKVVLVLKMDLIIYSLCYAMMSALLRVPVKKMTW